MVRHIKQKLNNESWKTLPWKKFHKVVFRLQMRIYKAVRAGDMAKARNLQKLLLRSYVARMLAIRQVTQLNAGKKPLVLMARLLYLSRKDLPLKEN